MPVQRHPSRQARDELLLEQVAQAREGRRRAGRQLGPGQVGGGAQGDRERDVLGAGAQAALLAAACDERTQGDPGATYRAPMPLGAYILWPTTVSRSAPHEPTSTGTLPAAWAASTCSSTPRARVIAPTSRTGCRVPVSLLAAIS